MENYQKQVEIRWSDLDPNFHLRHSIYYDWGAYCRISFMTEGGISPAVMKEDHIGPIVFREECVFKREIQFADKVVVNLQLAKANSDFSRWTMIHEIWKNDDILSAVLTIDGAWINTAIRKLTAPGEAITALVKTIPRSPNFQLTESK